MAKQNILNHLDKNEFGQVLAWTKACLRHKNGKKLKKNEEKKWGNKMLGNKKESKMWTAYLGEGIVEKILKEMGGNPTRPERKEKLRPDWETSDAIYEIKTRNWTTSGTAGEKVFGVPYKYARVPKIYGKPLKIICIAYQEKEHSVGEYKIFGNKLYPEHKKMLDFWKTMNIEFIPFTEFAKEYY